MVSPDGTESPIRAAGSNTHGQLGLGHTEIPRGISEDRGPSFEVSLRHGRLAKLACGTEHALTLWTFQDSETRPEVWCWGWNEHGNLGLGTRQDAHVPMKVTPQLPDGSQVIDIWAGSGTSWICCR